MRFKRRGRFAFSDTPRKRAHVLRKQQSERDALPLFAALIASEQEDVDTVIESRAALWADAEARDRARRALKWREARARLRAYPHNGRQALAAYWNRCGWPADPEYLMSMLHMYDTGRLNLAAHIGPYVVPTWAPIKSRDASEAESYGNITQGG